MAILAEEWRDAIGAPGYLVSNLGNLKRSEPVYSGRKHAVHGIAKSAGKDGVLRAHIIVDGVSKSVPVNRIVYDSFVKRRINNEWVGHIDGDKKNCCASNLFAYVPVRSISMVGKQFHYWTVLEYCGDDGNRNRKWLCRCVCGVEKQIAGQHLRYGASKSCGCKSREMAKSKVTGDRHYSWKGGVKNVGSLAWCNCRLCSLREGVRRYGGSDIVSTAEDIYALWIKSGGVCAACGDMLPAETKNIHLDHNHRTGVVRGFLCAGCNVAIGMAKDCPKRLRRIAKYLASAG